MFFFQIPGTTNIVVLSAYLDGSLPYNYFDTDKTERRLVADGQTCYDYAQYPELLIGEAVSGLEQPRSFILDDCINPKDVPSGSTSKDLNYNYYTGTNCTGAVASGTYSLGDNMSGIRLVCHRLYV